MKRAGRVSVMALVIGAVLVLVIAFLIYRESKSGPVHIGVCQIASHPSLDAVRDGAIRALAEAGYEDGKRAKVSRYNAEGDMGTAKTIIDTMVAQKVDLVVPITTPMAQAAANATKEIPIVFGAVTDPVGAGIVESLDRPGSNCTGVSDIWPIQQDLELLKRICPNARSVGTIYNAGEANSLVTIKLIRKACENLGLELREVTVSRGTEVLGAAESLAGKVDTLFTAADSTVGAAFESVIKVARERKIPLFVGDPDSVKRGAIACQGVDYENVGRLTGELAAGVLNGADPSTTPVRVITSTLLVVNPAAARSMGVTIPQDVIESADEVVDGDAGHQE